MIKENTEFTRKFIVSNSVIIEYYDLEKMSMAS